MMAFNRLRPGHLLTRRNSVNDEFFDSDHSLQSPTDPRVVPYEEVRHRGGMSAEHLLTCSSMKGCAMRSNFSSMGFGKAALTNLAASLPNRIASTACMCSTDSSSRHAMAREAHMSVSPAGSPPLALNFLNQNPCRALCACMRVSAPFCALHV